MTGYIHDFIKSKQNDLEAIAFSSILYNPVLYLAKNNIEINISPVALNESEGKFIKDLKEFCNKNLANFCNRELYIIRNKSKKGVGFFENSGFYPDFIMWVIENEKQHIVFIEPHGMRNTAFTDEKVNLSTEIKEIEKELNNSNVTLESFILSSTKYVDLSDKTYSKANWNAKHVFFIEDEEYLQKIFDVVR